MSGETADLVRWFEDLDNDDVPLVGGKNASLGEMIQTLSEAGIRVPGGFATTADAYRAVVEHNDLADLIREHMDALDSGEETLSEAGEAIRHGFRSAEFPAEFESAIRDAYRELSKRNGVEEVDVAVRSSATAEDLPSASFAGQQETFLNVVGGDELIDAAIRCFASLFTDRAISYRNDRGFDHLDVALSVGVQKMVRSDVGAAGVMFTLETETGFPDLVVINGSWGLGETVVQGSVNPDEYEVFKPLLEDGDLVPIVEKILGEKAEKIIYTTDRDSPTERVETTEIERNSFVLSDDEILTLARWGVSIEQHYGRPMDIEWAKDGETEEMFIVQARPETVQSQVEKGALETYRLSGEGEALVEGMAVGTAIATGPVKVIADVSDIDRFEKGDVLVTERTDPDWVPIMKQAAAIVTDHGGRTSHAAIVSRELGIPAIVGTGDATEVLESGSRVTVSCAEGETGFVYEGELEFESEKVDLSHLPTTETRIMLIIASPEGAMRWWRLPARGVGLARMEFLINNVIKIHPVALARFDSLTDEGAKHRIEELTEGYEDKTEYFVDRLARGIGRIAASQHPDPVIVRMSDFKTNEYADLIGGSEFEPEESNPMLGFRGASRYTSPRYRDGFALECRAIRRVREEMGFENVLIMIPFCRTVDEAERVLEVLSENGLSRGENGLEVYMMSEIPSNVVLAAEFAEHFDGFSIGSNDLTQLLLGVDRDSEELAELFDERDPAVTRSIQTLIERVHEAGLPIGICGQAPSDHPEFADLLVDAGIDTISVNPDSVVTVLERVAERETG